MEKKKCSKCGIEKEFDEFHKDNRRENGRKAQCKACAKEYKKKYNAKPEAKVAIKEYNKSPKRKESSKKYEQSQKGKITQKKYRGTPKRKVVQNRYTQSENGKMVGKKYRASPERKATRKKYGDQYWAKMENYFKHIARTLWKNSKQWVVLEALFESQNGRCALSDIRINRNNISIDHITPKSKGGDNKLDNLQFVIRDVNNAKRALSQEDFIDLCRMVVVKTDVPSIE